MSNERKVVKVNELEKEVREVFKEVLAKEWAKDQNARLLSVKE